MTRLLSAMRERMRRLMDVSVQAAGAGARQA